MEIVTAKKRSPALLHNEQCCGSRFIESGSRSSISSKFISSSGSRVLMTKVGKNTADKKSFFIDQKLKFTYP